MQLFNNVGKSYIGKEILIIKKRSSKNLLFGLLNQIITLTLGIVIPKLYISYLGSETNGLMTVITQLFAYVALLEAGLGNTTLQALYKPLAKKDKEGINGIMAATNSYYKHAGIQYIIAVIILAIAYPFVIESSIALGKISAVIILTGIPGAINFLIQGKYKVLLQAEGKQYFVNNVNTLISLCVNISKAVLVLHGFGIVEVQVAYCIFNIFQMTIYYTYMRRHYNWIDLSVTKNRKALSQKKSVFIHQISGLVFSNTDVLLISYFCGLSDVSIYAVYSLVSGVIGNLINTINESFIYLQGQYYYSDRSKFIKLFDVTECIFNAIIFSLYTVTYILIIPFISLYTKGADINYIDYKLPILFVIFQILNAGRKVPQNAINIAGHFEKTQSRAIIEATINLICSMLLIPYFGIYGALLGTILALVYRTNDIIIYANLEILERSPLITYKRWAVNIGTTILLIWSSYYFSIDITTYFSFICWGIVLIIIILPIFLLVMLVFNWNVFDIYFKPLFKNLDKLN